MPGGLCYHQIMTEGEQKAWEDVDALVPETMAESALLERTGNGYVIRCLGADLLLSLAGRTITGQGPVAEDLTGRHGNFLRLSALTYLAHAKDVPPTGRLVKPEGLKGGRMFSQGTHVLPLDALADKYGSDGDAFVARAIELGGKVITGMGDAAVELAPLPRVPVTLVLWLGDDEFSPRTVFMFDSSCEFQAPLDALWSAATLTVLMML